jgi:hypothetical protein
MSVEDMQALLVPETLTRPVRLEARAEPKTS